MLRERGRTLKIIGAVIDGKIEHFPGTKVRSEKSTTFGFFENLL